MIRYHTLSRPLALLALGLVACQGGAAEHADPSESAEALAEGPLALTLVQDGFFGSACAACPESRVKRPLYVHYGYASQRGGTWEAVADLPIAYDGAGLSEPVIINVPAERREQLLGYSFAYRPLDGSSGPDRFTNNRYVDLRYPGGKFVHLNAGVQSPYPFYDSCYSTYVTNQGEAQTSFQGKPSMFFYGFTTQTAAEYAANNDVPWENASRQPGAEGTIDRFDFVHNGSFKGAYIMGSEWVRVPEGRNLVFKLSYRKFSSYCSQTSPSTSAETKKYFTQVN